MQTRQIEDLLRTAPGVVELALWDGADDRPLIVMRGGSGFAGLQPRECGASEPFFYTDDAAILALFSPENAHLWPARWWASCTKAVFAYATHVAISHGFLSLTDSVSDLLGCKFVCGGSECEVTVGDLLRHSSGLPHALEPGLVNAHSAVLTGAAGIGANEVAIETSGSVAAGADLSLNPAQMAYGCTFNLHYAPGARRIYSNLGFDLLAQCVEVSTGVNAGHWLQMAVLDPLSMRETRFLATAAADCPDRRHSRFGLDILDGASFASVARDLRGPLPDLVQFLRQLLSPTLLADVQLQKALVNPLVPLVGLVPGYGRQKDCAWSYGFELHGNKNPHWMAPMGGSNTFGHFGLAGSFVWVEPELKRGAVFLSSRNFEAWHKENWPKINDILRAF